MLRSAPYRALLLLALSSVPAICQEVAAHVTDTTAVRSAGRTVQDAEALDRTRRLIDEIRAASFPELRGVRIRLELLDHESDFLRARFAFCQFLTGRRMLYLVRVNPEIYSRQAPAEGVRAIIAHELAHIVWYSQRNRFRLFGLSCLVSAKYAARFERRTDLLAIARGYGEGLKAYRRWLYQQVSGPRLAEKRRNYFSPEEVEAIEARLRQQPALLDYWLRHVPLSLAAILAAPAAAVP